MPAALKRFFSVLLIIAVGAGIWTTYRRSAAENTNRRVEIAIDSRLLWRDDFGGGRPGAAQLRELKDAGCTAVALNPLTLVELEAIGLVSLADTAEIQKLYRLGAPGHVIDELPQGLYVNTAKQEIYAALRQSLSPLLDKLPGLPKEAASVRNLMPGGYTLFIPGRYVQPFKELPLLFPREQMVFWNREGFRLIPLFNLPSRLPETYSEKYWEALLLQLQEPLQSEEIEVGSIAFTAANYAYPTPQSMAGQAIRDAELPLGVVEFTQGKGLKPLAASLGYNILKTHQILISEMGQLGEERSIERFVRAVQERKVRTLLLYPFPELDPRGDFEAYLGYVGRLRNDLGKAGFFPGEAVPFAEANLPAVFQSLFGTGIVAAVLFMAGLFLFKENPFKVDGAGPGEKTTFREQRRQKRLERQKKELFLGISIVLLLVAFLLPLLGWGPLFSPGFFRKGAALTAALVFPILSVAVFLYPLTHRDKIGKKGYPGKLLKGFLLATALTTGGALIAAGMLLDTACLLKIDCFQGVKISQAGPFLLLGLFLLLQKGRERGDSLKKETLRLLEQHIEVKHLLLIVLAGGVFLVYLIRGGNFPILPVSQWELAVRRYLEVLLVARPRFKEFAIGHPGFFFLAALIPGRIKGAQTLALLLALLGQISIFNTFMHLHRPVSLSLLGTAYGAVLGALLGIILYLLAAWIISIQRNPF